MSLQTSLGHYFTTRKRRAGDDIQAIESNKVLILDKNVSDVSLTKESVTLNGEGTILKKNVIYNDSPKLVKIVKTPVTAPKLPRKTPRSTSGFKKNRQNKESTKSSDIRKSLLTSFNASVKINESSDQENNSVTSKDDDNVALKKSSEVNVPFVIKGLLSPKKQCNPKVGSTPAKLKSAIAASKKSDGDTLENIRSKLINSSRLDEIKKSLKNINASRAKLENIEEKLSTHKSNDSPSLKKFSSINLEISSPTKKLKEPSCVKVPSSSSLLQRAILMSPGKNQGPSLPYVSPRKLFTEGSPIKSYEKFSHLSPKEKTSLILPFSYRSLAETFRAIDAVVSMMFNRNETIFFSKLKTSVQQMSKKNLTENHLGQIQTIYPDAFTYHQEKIRQGPSLPVKYELVIKPVIVKSGDCANKEKDNTVVLMTPTINLERRRKLYSALLELAKDHHQAFLLTLDPPMEIEKNKVTRWHPEFDVDSVPEITPSLLPQPPNADKFSSAKDVLTKARDIFICNPRMARALEKNSVEPQIQNSNSAAASIPALTSALKGIPKSLLEKVRAKQAAKAASMLTINPESTKKRIEYSRLPEIARIVRNTFIAEKKTVIFKSVLLERMNSSYREVLTPNDMNHHLDLLMKSNPDWITTIDHRDEHYLKILKEVDLAVIYANIDKHVKQI